MEIYFFLVSESNTFSTQQLNNISKILSPKLSCILDYKLALATLLPYNMLLKIVKNDMSSLLTV